MLAVKFNRLRTRELQNLLQNSSRQLQDMVRQASELVSDIWDPQAYMWVLGLPDLCGEPMESVGMHRHGSWLRSTLA